jgi:hypothetical protein
VDPHIWALQAGRAVPVRRSASVPGRSAEAVSAVSRAERFERLANAPGSGSAPPRACTLRR